MLGKLIKHEFKNSARQMLTLLAVVILVTVFGFAAGNTISYANNNNLNASVAAVLIEVVFMLSIFSIYIIVFVQQCESYYKTMYSLRGYLTHTLPANELELLSSKLIVSFAWIVATTLVCIGAGMLVINSITGGEFFASLNRVEWSLMAKMLYSKTGISAAQLILYVLLFFAIGVLTSLLFIFFCMAVGQLSTKNRKAVSILTGIGLQFLLMFISTSVTRLFVRRVVNIEITRTDLSFYPPLVMWTFWGMCLAVGVLLFLGCYLINRKHLNLE